MGAWGQAQGSRLATRHPAALRNTGLCAGFAPGEVVNQASGASSLLSSSSLYIA